MNIKKIHHQVLLRLPEDGTRDRFKRVVLALPWTEYHGYHRGQLTRKLVLPSVAEEFC
jgi:hypothetical protein